MTAPGDGDRRGGEIPERREREENTAGLWDFVPGGGKASPGKRRVPRISQQNAAWALWEQNAGTAVELRDPGAGSGRGKGFGGCSAPSRGGDVKLERSREEGAESRLTPRSRETPGKKGKRRKKRRKKWEKKGGKRGKTRMEGSGGD